MLGRHGNLFEDLTEYRVKQIYKFHIVVHFAPFK